MPHEALHFQNHSVLQPFNRDIGKGVRGGDSIFILLDLQGLDTLTYGSLVRRSSNKMPSFHAELEANTSLALDLQPQTCLSRIIPRILTLALSQSSKL
jgi:hypothetical protein